MKPHTITTPLLWLWPLCLSLSAASAQAPQGYGQVMPDGEVVWKIKPDSEQTGPRKATLQPQRTGPVSLHLGSIPAANTLEHKSHVALSHGEALIKAGALNGAIAAYQEALSYEPDDGLAYQRLAEAQTAAGALNDAAATYRTLLYKWPGKNWSNSQNGDPAVHMQFALVLLKAGQRDEALSVYQRGYQLLQSELWDGGTGKTDDRPLPPLFTSPGFDPARFAASAYTVIGIHKHEWMDRDAPDFEQAIQLQPTLAAAYFYRGLSWKDKRGRASDALLAFAQASHLGGAEIQPFVDKARQDGSSEFKAAVKKAER